MSKGWSSRLKKIVQIVSIEELLLQNLIFFTLNDDSIRHLESRLKMEDES